VKKKVRKIGRFDKANLPEFGIENINVKIDTGSYNSSIHCSEIKEIIVDDKTFIRFKLLDSDHPKFFFDELYSDKFVIKKIRSSNGISEMRYVIESEIELYNVIYKTTFSLTNRSEMKYPILLGRKLLAKNFLVDVNKKNLSYKYRTKKKVK